MRGFRDVKEVRKPQDDDQEECIGDGMSEYELEEYMSKHLPQEILDKPLEPFGQESTGIIGDGIGESALYKLAEKVELLPQEILDRPLEPFGQPSKKA